VFNKKDPIVVGVEVVEGIARVGTPLAVPTQAGIELGRIASLELNHKAVDSARAGQSVAMKIEPGALPASYTAFPASCCFDFYCGIAVGAYDKHRAGQAVVKARKSLLNRQA
jgi:hypothetical protein